jgi:hypothetical protein
MQGALAMRHYRIEANPAGLLVVLLLPQLLVNAAVFGLAFGALRIKRLFVKYLMFSLGILIALYALLIPARNFLWEALEHSKPGSEEQLFFLFVVLLWVLPLFIVLFAARRWSVAR